MSILFYLLFLLRICLCSLYIDLKNNYISPGIKVFHGYYLTAGIYRFFIGETESIRSVKYGDVVIFPNEDYINLDYTIFVECFYKEKIFVIVHVETKVITRRFKSRFFYHVHENYLEQFKTYPKMILNRTCIRISIDIDPNADKHPFIDFKTLHDDYLTETTFEIKREYDKIKFNGINAPIYTIGRIHYSSLPVYVILSKHDLFIDKCDKVSIKHSHHFFEVFVYENNLYVFKMQYLFNIRSFKYQDEIMNVTNRVLKEALLIKKFLAKHDLDLFGSYLDIAEKIHPSQYGIFRSTGIVGLRGYTLYDMKQTSQPINYIIDTTSGSPFIHTPDPNEKVMFVEIIVEYNLTHIIVNSTIDQDGIKEEKLQMYYKEPTECRYQQSFEGLKTKKMQIIKEDYPIALNLDLDDKNTTFIYDRINLNDDKFNFTYFYMNDGEYFSQDLRSKYIFGSVSDIDPFEVGNIPSEKFVKKYRLVKENLDCQEFLIKNPLDDTHFDQTQYEVYRLVK